MEPKLDLVKGCIFGLAIGDALGATVENLNSTQIKNKFGILKDILGAGWLGLRPGQFTDDTQMMLCLAHSLVEKKGFDINDIAHRYVIWKNSNPPDIGRTVRKAVTNLENGVPPTKSGIPAPAAGNGSVMRCAPIGIAFCNSKFLEEYSMLDSGITHANPMCRELCAMINLMISKLIKGEELKQVFKSVTSKIDYKDNQTIVFGTQPANYPSAYILDTLPTVFAALNNNSDFESTLITVVNYGGDADTTGAICGAIAGAYYGFSSIPKKWLDKIDCYEELEKVSIGLLELSKKIKK